VIWHQPQLQGQGEDPFSTMRVDGRSCRLFRNDEAARAIEHMEGMLPWNGKADNMIDRFDGRALLDFYRHSPSMPFLEHGMSVAHCPRRPIRIRVQCQGYKTAMESCTER
jgi:hypothetical protein